VARENVGKEICCEEGAWKSQKKLRDDVDKTMESKGLLEGNMKDKQV
jgi:hypothetical protein